MGLIHSSTITECDNTQENKNEITTEITRQKDDEEITQKSKNNDGIKKEHSPQLARIYTTIPEWAIREYLESRNLK
jgi:hypothetical protein